MFTHDKGCRMIHSMTAFARGQRETPLGVLSWELRSVNHRFLDIALHLPDELRGLEVAARERLGAVLKRGKIEACLRLQIAGPLDDRGSELPVNQILVSQLLRAAQQVNTLLTNPAPVSALDILRWPGVMQTASTSATQSDATALALLDEVTAELMAVRAREGDKMKVLLEQRSTTMENTLTQVRANMPAVLEQLRTRLAARCAELKTELDPARLEQEVLLLVHKADVDEELGRLAMHIKEVRRLLGADEPVGRRLDFLMQELNREANTLGAKAAEIKTTNASIELKVLIEQMREHIQNIE